jgi:hypothetical protein
MRLKNARSAIAAAILLSGLCMPTAFANTGGHGGGGGSHGSGGHAGGGAHFAGHAFAGHPYAGHAYAPRSFVGSRATYVGASHAAAAGRWAGPTGGVGHGAVAARVAGPGYGHGGHWGGRWGGGYWGGRYWPGAYYGPGFAWFLPALPLYCATFWWNSVPYYYYNDVYYTWSPTADGYVATYPPPAAAASAPSAPDGNYDGGAPSGAYSGSGTAGPAPAPSDADAIPPGEFASGGGSDNVFAYPANGQSEQQQAADRAECDRWAGSQAGGANGSPDYRRAVIACFQGRGYSAQ